MSNPTINWTGKSILVVEDDTYNFNYLDILLKPTLAKVLHARDGLKAVELFKSSPEIDIVLMDIMLPDISGIEVTRKILNLRRDIPVIAQTAYVTETNRKNALDAGCCEFLPKPIRANEMLHLMLKYLASND
jgi:CheY-like chemotaxis protein